MPTFEPSEYAARTQRATQALREAGLDAIILFAPESHYWLTGYDTFGFAMFQAMVLDADGRVDLLTRLPDLRQAQLTSVIPHARIHVWPEHERADPAADLAGLIATLGLRGGRIGVETRTAGLTYFNGLQVARALPDLVEASDLIPALRRRKSEAEIACIRRAAALSDDALDAALAEIAPGASEAHVHAAMQAAILSGGGEPAGNETIIGSGPFALLCRSFVGRRQIAAEDQLTLEWSGSYLRYHAAMMRTVIIGPPTDADRRMHRAASEALEACEAALVPGRPMADVYDAHAKVFDAHGLHDARLQACGYHMGIAYAPIWVEFPMFYAGNPVMLEVGQTFFLHMILMDSAGGRAMTLGHSLHLGENGPERLSRHGTELITR